MALRRSLDRPKEDIAKPSAYEDLIRQQLDQLMRISSKERESVLGPNWIEETERFYNLKTDRDVQYPSFRPTISVPQLQFQMLSESSDLSDLQPRVYIVKSGMTDRDKAREEGFRAQWDHGNYNLQAMIATIWSLFAGNGYLEVVLNPLAFNGEGEVRVLARHPGSTFPDPYARSDEDMAWVVFEDDMFLDEVRLRWPENGPRVRLRRPGSPNASGTKLQLLPGPMSSIGGFPASPAEQRAQIPSDSRVRVRRLYVRDYAVKTLIKPQKPDPEDVLIRPKKIRKYVSGRLIVECEGIVLYDGPSPVSMFPVVTFFGTPPITGHFCPPPINYSRDLQDMAERMYRQLYENAIRLNNGITFIDENTGIDIEDYGGIPAEVHMIATGSRPPETKYPNPMPPDMVKLPETLLSMQKEIQGFTPARRGETASGNVSAPLYDASVMQAQSVTRLRARFMAVSFQRLAEIVFEFMGRFYTSKRSFPSFKDEDYKPVGWDPMTDYDPEDYKLKVDQASIRPYSAAAMRSMVPLMRQMGLIDIRSAQELLEIPNREEIQQRLSQENQAKAQAEAMKKTAGGKGPAAPRKK